MKNFLLAELIDKTALELSNVAKKSNQKNLTKQEEFEVTAQLITFSRFILLHYDEAKRIMDTARKGNLIPHDL